MERALQIPERNPSVLTPLPLQVHRRNPARQRSPRPVGRRRRQHALHQVGAALAVAPPGASCDVADACVLVACGPASPQRLCYTSHVPGTACDARHLPDPGSLCSFNIKDMYMHDVTLGVFSENTVRPSRQSLLPAGLPRLRTRLACRPRGWCVQPKQGPPGAHAWARAACARAERAPACRVPARPA